MAGRSSEEVLRRKLIATFVFQGVAAYLLLVVVAISHAGDTARVLSELGGNGPPLIGIFFALAFALSLFKFGAEPKRIFDQFYQVDSRNVRSRKGTGLGLSLARGLVDLHDGRIGVDSTEGRGSTFTVVLPIDCENCGDTSGRGSGIPEAVDSQRA